jgi:hypothetical protein
MSRERLKRRQLRNTIKRKRRGLRSWFTVRTYVRKAVVGEMANIHPGKKLWVVESTGTAYVTGGIV